MGDPRAGTPGRLALSRPDKVLFPDVGVTKADLAEYLERIAPLLLPHLADRPLALKRYPDGIEAKGFFQKDATGRAPAWVRTAGIPRRDGKVLQHVVVDDVATLRWLADQAALELHGLTARAPHLDHPDQLVVDLDPEVGDVAGARQAARAVRDLFEEVGLGEPRLKTSGSKGFHLHVALDGTATTGEVVGFARASMAEVARRDPERLTVERRVDARGGRVYLDVGRNGRGQTVAVPYGVRARPGAPVATPIGWDELGRTAPDRWTVRNLFRRLGQREDPWAGEPRRHGLADARRALAELAGDA